MKELIATARREDARGPRHAHRQVAAHQRKGEQAGRGEITSNDGTMTLVMHVLGCNE